MPRLVFLDERFGGRSYELICERTTVGRGSENTLTIRDASLSGEHCEILTYGSEVIVRDLGSRNGTFIDGHRLNANQAQAKHDQIISFGAVEVRLDIEYVNEDGSDDDTFHDSVKFGAQQNHSPAVEALHVSVPETGGPIDGNTIHLKASALPVPSEQLSPGPAVAVRSRRPQPIWIAVWIALLLALLLSLWR